MRPNKDKIPGYFDAETVGVQLRYTGVLETTRIRRLGFSHRVPFAEFVKRYWLLVSLNRSNLANPRESSAEILQKLGFLNWKIGKTKVFLKYYHAEKLSHMFEEMNKKATVIQCAIRGWMARRSFVKRKFELNNAATVIQKCSLSLLSLIF